MPIFEYECHACDARFEKLTTLEKADKITCAACGSEDVERLLSVFGVGSARPKSPCEGGSCAVSECAAANSCGCPHLNP